MNHHITIGTQNSASIQYSTHPCFYFYFTFAILFVNLSYMLKTSYNDDDDGTTFASKILYAYSPKNIKNKKNKAKKKTKTSPFIIINLTSFLC